MALSKEYFPDSHSLQSNKLREEVIGKRVTEAFPGAEKTGILTALKQVHQTAEPIHVPSSLYEDSRIVIWVDNYIYPLKSGEIVAIFDDITDQKELEEERAAIEERLRQAQKMEAVGTLAGGIAHDFNNILAGIIGYTELLLDDIPSEMPYRENAQAILKSSNRAKNLVRQILDFSRQVKHTKEPIRLGPVIEESVKLLRASIPTTIEMKCELPQDDAVVRGDPTQVHQVIMNLASNAADAMAERGGKLSLTLESIAIGVDGGGKFIDLKPGRYHKITVEDTGQGMDHQTVSRIFEPFFTTKEVGKGTGPGLSVVHGIVKDHGGEITVDSQPNRGTVFSVYLPATDLHQAAVSTQRASLPRGTESILFVDDEQTLVDFNEQMLKRLGYDVTATMSSLDALKAIENDPNKFDLVITDMTMPKMTGLDLAKEIVSIRPDMPIILCTGFSNQLDDEKLRVSGIKKLLMKPLSFKDAAFAIRELLDKKA